ncbi:hypothetical protein Tco_0526932 [Tanacetum coccineum]
MTTLVEFMIIADANKRPPMLEKSLYDSWKSQNDTTRTKKYEELSVAEKLQATCDLQATNIILQGLPPDVYAIVNLHKVAKDIWDRVKLLMQGTKLSLQEKECLVVPVFNQRDDPIAHLNKAMAFLITVASSRFHSTNNQHRTSSNPRNQATIQDDRVTIQQVQGRQRQSYAGNSYKGNATSSGGNNVGGQAKEKAMLAEAQESGQILDEEQLAFHADPGILDFLMANLSNYGSYVMSEVMAALVISISLDVSVESVGSSFPRLILIDSISVEVPVAPEVGRLQFPQLSGCSSLILIHHDSESDTEIPKRHVSPTTSTPEIPTAPILPMSSTVVAPSSEFYLAPVDAPPRIRRR